MQLQHVRYFLAVRQERSFTQAARRCGVSQPSLTNAVRRLEQHLGGALFKRKPEVELLCLATRSTPTCSASPRTQILLATRRRLW
jgi:transposase-like protein